MGVLSIDCCTVQGYLRIKLIPTCIRRKPTNTAYILSDCRTYSKHIAEYSYHRFAKKTGGDLTLMAAFFWLRRAYAGSAP